jgi:hypothetical protein
MSDMIDRLSAIANEAGADSAARLTADDITATLATQVRRDVRARRVVASAVALTMVVVGAAGAVVAPRLLDPPAVLPAGETRVPVQTNEGLITYSDGSMEVLTQSGLVVEVPAPEEGAPVFGQELSGDACAADPTQFKPGWTAAFPEAFELVTFARALSLDSTGCHVLPQGQRVIVGHDYKDTEFAFSVDVDPAIAPHVVMTASSYTLAPDGRVGYFHSQLESTPGVDYSGDRASGTYTATLTTRPLGYGTSCKGASAMANEAAATGALKYLVVTVFINDGHGQLSPIGTHTSWVTLAKEDA